MPQGRFRDLRSAFHRDSSDVVVAQGGDREGTALLRLGEGYVLDRFLRRRRVVSLVI